MKYIFLYINIIFIGDKVIIKYLKYFCILLLSIIIPTFILTIFNYFEVFSNNVIDILKLIITLISILINSFYLGKNSKSKGYIEGLPSSIFLTVVFFKEK